MTIAVINFSGNVGKTTLARHLLLPRIDGASLISVESLKADDAQGQALRGRQFGELQAYLQTVESVVVDIGASNVEDLLNLMHRYRRSHEDFDCFVVPTVPALKQQQDTIATLVELAGLGVTPSRLKLVFNMVPDDVDVEQAFSVLLAFLRQQPLTQANPDCRLGLNEIYEVAKRGQGADARAAADLAVFARDSTDYKALIVRAGDMSDKLTLAHKLATQRLARGVVSELDACFAALGLGTTQIAPPGSVPAGAA